MSGIISYELLGVHALDFSSIEAIPCNDSKYIERLEFFSEDNRVNGIEFYIKDATEFDDEIIQAECERIIKKLFLRLTMSRKFDLIYCSYRHRYSEFGNRHIIPLTINNWVMHGEEKSVEVSDLKNFLSMNYPNTNKNSQQQLMSILSIPDSSQRYLMLYQMLYDYANDYFKYYRSNSNQGAVAEYIKEKYPSRTDIKLDVPKSNGYGTEDDLSHLRNLIAHNDKEETKDNQNDIISNINSYMLKIVQIIIDFI